MVPPIASQCSALEIALARTTFAIVETVARLQLPCIYMRLTKKYQNRSLFQRGPALIVAALLAFHAGLLAYAATRHSPSIDEIGHLPAGLNHWQLGRTEMYRVNPPLIRLVTVLPLLATDAEVEWARLENGYNKQLPFAIGRDFIQLNGRVSFWYFSLARWACIPFSLLGGYVCFLWARELYGPWAGLMALVLWSFDPNILAHGQMITPDVGAAALGITACFGFWRWLRAPSIRGALLAGLLLGLAELTKTTWIILFAVLPLLWMICRQKKTDRAPVASWIREACQVALMLIFALYVLNVGYGFDGSFDRVKSYSFHSTMMQDLQSAGGMQHSLGALPVPLPRNYVLGIDEQRLDFEKGIDSYLGGEWRHGGWWYYYLYGLAIKVPLGTWILLLIATGITVVGMLRRTINWRAEVVLFTPAVIVFTLVSSQTGFNHHLRYVLPIFPFVFVATSKVAAFVMSRGWWVRVLCTLPLMWSIVSSLAVYPHSLSYFNETVGGPKGGSAHLVDSNIDWGQDVLHLKKWLDRHPEAKPLGFAYFGYFDPSVAGIEYTLPPPDETMADHKAILPLGPRPGWYAISVTILRGYRFPLPDGEGGRVIPMNRHYSYFQQFRPVAMAGYSIYIYHITPDEANRVRREMNLPPLKEPPP